MIGTFNRFVRAHRSKLLMVGLVILQIASPLADSHPHIGGVIALLVVLTMIAGSSYMTDKRAVRLVILPLTGVWLTTRMVEALSPPHRFYSHLAPVVGLALSCSVLWAILNRIDSVPMVTGNVIAEAFICYVIIAIAFAQLYWILNQLVYNAFSEPIGADNVSLLLYFSMTSLSTVGYGRVVAINPYVRIIAAIEAMTGVFFIAVVVARLVSSYRIRPRRGR